MSVRYVIGLDIGTTKICALVTRVEADVAEVIGMGTVGASGLKKGVVVDMDMTTSAVMEAKAEAEASSGVELKSAYVGVAGGHIKCEKSYGATGIKGPEVGRPDIDRVLDSAAAVYVPLDREILHVLPTDYVIDGQEGIRAPMGMTGARMEANVRIITASQSAVENIIRCVKRAGIEVIEAVFEPLASTKAVTRPDELETGAAVIDIGGGTADVAVYREGGLWHASVLPVGGNHLTNDIAIGLKVSQSEAEAVKREFGTVEAGLDSMELISVKGMNDSPREVPRSYLKDILRPRCEEMLRLLREEMAAEALYGSPSCVVLTGGTSLIKGLDRLAEGIFGLPVRVGAPEGSGAFAVDPALKSPIYSTAAGLVLYGLAAEHKNEDGLFDGLVRRVRGTTRNLLEVKGWGISRKSRRPALRGQ